LATFFIVAVMSAGVFVKSRTVYNCAAMTNLAWQFS